MHFEVQAASGLLIAFISSGSGGHVGAVVVSALLRYAAFNRWRSLTGCQDFGPRVAHDDHLLSIELSCPRTRLRTHESQTMLHVSRNTGLDFNQSSNDTVLRMGNGSAESTPLLASVNDFRNWASLISPRLAVSDLAITPAICACLVRRRTSGLRMH